MNINMNMGRKNPEGMVGGRRRGLRTGKATKLVTDVTQPCRGSKF
jgi:hypothetical protein